MNLFQFNLLDLENIIRLVNYIRYILVDASHYGDDGVSNARSVRHIACPHQLREFIGDTMLNTESIIHWATALDLATPVCNSIASGNFYSFAPSRDADDRRQSGM